jgi:lysine-arginine-ornithine-binding protein
MRQWLLSALAAAGLVAATHVGAHAAGSDTVRIATEADYAPFEYKDSSGKLQGFEIELGNALCAKAQIKCEWVNMDFDSMIAALGAHKVDAILSQMSITPDRAKKVDFTNAITLAPARFVAAKGSKITEDPQSLKGKVLGVQSGTTHETYARQKLGGIVDIKVYQGQDEAFQDLKAGRIDATLADSTIEYDWLQKDGKDGYEYVGKPLEDPAIFGSGTGIAVRKGDTKLLNTLNTAFAGLKKDGTFQKINAEYFPFSIEAK